MAVLTKVTLLFIFDRVTGEPIFGIEERPVPKSTVPGEAGLADAAVPAEAAAARPHHFDPAKDFYTLTPEHAAFCKDLWDKQRDVHRGRLHAAGPRAARW